MKITTRYGQCHNTDCDQCVRGWCQWPCEEREHALQMKENEELEKEIQND